MAAFYNCISYGAIESYAGYNKKAKKKKGMHCKSVSKWVVKGIKIDVFKLKLIVRKQLILERWSWSSGICKLLLRCTAVDTKLEAKIHEEGCNIGGIFVIEFHIVWETDSVGDFHEAFFRVFITYFGQKFCISILDGGGKFIDIAIESCDEVFDSYFVTSWINCEFRFDEGSITGRFKIF